MATPIISSATTTGLWVYRLANWSSETGGGILRWGSVPGHRVDLAYKLLVNLESRDLAVTRSRQLEHLPVWMPSFSAPFCCYSKVMSIRESHRPGMMRSMRRCESGLRREATRCREEGNSDGARAYGSHLGRKSNWRGDRFQRRSRGIRGNDDCRDMFVRGPLS